MNSWIFLKWSVVSWKRTFDGKTPTEKMETLWNQLLVSSSNPQSSSSTSSSAYHQAQARLVTTNNLSLWRQSILSALLLTSNVSSLATSFAYLSSLVHNSPTFLRSPSQCSPHFRSQSRSHSQFWSFLIPPCWQHQFVRILAEPINFIKSMTSYKYFSLSFRHNGQVKDRDHY